MVRGQEVTGGLKVTKYCLRYRLPKSLSRGYGQRTRCDWRTKSHSPVALPLLLPLLAGAGNINMAIHIGLDKQKFSA